MGFGKRAILRKLFVKINQAGKPAFSNLKGKPTQTKDKNSTEVCRLIILHHLERDNYRVDINAIRFQCRYNDINYKVENCNAALNDLIAEGKVIQNGYYYRLPQSHAKEHTKMASLVETELKQYKARYQFILNGKVEFVISHLQNYQICASINKGEFKFYTQAEFTSALDYEILAEQSLTR